MCSRSSVVAQQGHESARRSENVESVFRPCQKITISQGRNKTKMEN